MTQSYIFSVLLIFLSAAFLSSAGESETIDPKAGKPDSLGRLVWYEASLLGIEGKGWTDTESAYERLPRKAKDTVRKPVWGLGKNTAGLLVRFNTAADSLHVRWTLSSKNLAMPHMPAAGVSGIDLYFRDEKGRLMFSDNGRPRSVSNEAAFQLPNSSEYVLYLPLYNGIKQLQLGIAAGKTLAKISAPKESVVFYGTSITQGGCASRPGMCGTSIAGREFGVNVINLGFSGNGRMEPEMAELLAELDPAAFVLDPLWNMTPKMVSERVKPFVKILRRTRPETPIFLAEDSSIKNRPTEDGIILRKIYKELIEAGDTNLYFIPNTGMLGEDGDATVDGCHLTDLGMMRQADVFIKHLRLVLSEDH